MDCVLTHLTLHLTLTLLLLLCMWLDHTGQPSLHITRCPLFDSLSEATNFDPQDLSFWSCSEQSSSHRNLAFCQSCLNSYTYPFSPVSNTNLKSCLFACCLLHSKPERYHCYRISVINFTSFYVVSLTIISPRLKNSQDFPQSAKGQGWTWHVGIYLETSKAKKRVWHAENNRKPLYLSQYCQIVKCTVARDTVSAFI